MEPAEFDNYVATRYEKQKQWYDTKSVTNRRWDRALSGAVFVVAAAVPLVVLIPPCAESWGRIAGACGSALIAITSGIGRMFGFHDLYINYRTIAETLKKEIHFYNAGIDAYANTADKEALFVQRVESLISRENTLWQEVAQRQMTDDSRSMGASSLHKRSTD